VVDAIRAAANTARER